MGSASKLANKLDKNLTKTKQKLDNQVKNVAGMRKAKKTTN